MNILFVFPDFTPYHGGVPMVTDILAKEFIKRGHEVVFLSQDPQYTNEDTVVPVISIDLSSSSEYSLIDYYQELLREKRIDIIINQLPLVSSNDFFLKYSLPNIKTISVYHSRPFGILKLIKNEIQTSTSLLNRLRTLLYYVKTAIFTHRRFSTISRNSDILCLLSPHYKELLKNIPCLKIQNIESIGNPLPIFRSLGTTTRKKQIVFVGRLSDKCKNLRGALDVWNIFVKRHPDWRFVVIGNDSGIDDIKQEITEKKISNIEFVGHTSNMEQYYSQSSFILVTSFYEGWPMVICEAMSYGCIPCVYNTYEAIQDLIQDGESGLICQPFNPQAMVDRLDKVLSCTEELNMMSRTAIDLIQNFKVDFVATQWEDLFNKLKKN